MSKYPATAYSIAKNTSLIASERSMPLAANEPIYIAANGNEARHAFQHMVMRAVENISEQFLGCQVRRRDCDDSGARLRGQKVFTSALREIPAGLAIVGCSRCYGQC